MRQSGCSNVLKGARKWAVPAMEPSIARADGWISKAAIFGSLAGIANRIDAVFERLNGGRVISSARRISIGTVSRPSARAAALKSPISSPPIGLSTFAMIATRWRLGTTSCNKPIRLPARSADSLDRPGDVAAWPRQTCYQTGANRIARLTENNWNGRCRLLCRDDCCGSRRDDDIDLQPDELGDDFGQTLAASFPPTVFDHNRSTFDPAVRTHALHKRVSPFALG